MTPSPQQEDRYDTLTSAERGAGPTPKQGRKELDHHPSRKTGMRLSPQLEDEHETLNQSRKTENRLSPHQEDRYETLNSAERKV
jgi:hypothetical protein